MKVLVVLFALVAFAASAPTEELDVLQAFDFDALFNNAEQRKVVFDCLLDKAPCGDFEKLKESVVKVVQNQCAECNPDQKEKYEHAMKTFHDKFEPTYNEFMKKLATKKE